MKKIAALILALMMACAMLPAMAEAATVAGTWYLTGLTIEGTTMQPSMFGLDMTLVLNEDNTAVFTVTQGAGEEPVSKDGSWELAEGSVVVTAGEDTLSLDIAEDTLTTDFPGLGLLVFSQAAPEAFQLPSPVVAETEDAFLGTWTVNAMNMAGQYVPFDMLGELTGGATITLVIESGKAVETEATEANTKETVFTSEFADGLLTMTAPNAVTGENEVRTYVLNDDGSISFSNDEMGLTAYYIRVPETAE